MREHDDAIQIKTRCERIVIQHLDNEMPADGADGAVGHLLVNALG